MARARPPEYCILCGKQLKALYKDQSHLPVTMRLIGDTFQGYKPCDCQQIKTITTMPNTLTPIKINDKELLFVPDKGIFYNFRIGKAGPNKGHLFASCTVTNGKKWELPDPGNWLLLGKGSEISEEQIKRIMPWFEIDGDKGYRDYKKDYLSFGCKTEIESLHSLIRSHGHEPELTVVLIKK